MRAYAVRALPWGQIAVCAGLLGVLLGAVRYDAWTLWPLQGTAVGLLAGAVGWCLDEPAAAVVDPSPRGLAWRTAARAWGIGILLGAWTAGVWWARDSLFGHAPSILVQGYAITVLTTAAVTHQRARGAATPGHTWALFVVPMTAAWSLVRPFEQTLPVFPYTHGDRYGDWNESSVGWICAGVIALVTLVLVLTREGIRADTRHAGRPTSRSELSPLRLR